MKYKLLSTILTLAVVFLCVQGAQSQVIQFKIPITVASGTGSQILNMGISGDGFGGIVDNTIGLDLDSLTFGLYQELPAPLAPPAPFDFDTRIVTIPGRTSTIPDGLGSGVYGDYRGFSSPNQVDSFKITIAGDFTDNGPTTISWPNNLNLYGTAWTIKPQAGSDWPTTNMLTSTSVEIPAGGHKNIIIIKAGAYNGSVFSASLDTLHIGQAIVPGFGETDSVTITNTGISDLLITGVTVTGGQFLTAPAGPDLIPPAGAKKYGVTFAPTTAGYQSGVLEFTSNASTSPNTVIVDGTGVLSPKFLTVVPDTIIVKDPVKGKLLKSVKRVKPGKPILAGPNWANLMDETVAQGGFQPGASESDTAGGLLIGKSFMFNGGGAGPAQKWKAMKIKGDTAWVRLSAYDFKKSIGKNYADFQKTLEDKTGKHDLYSRGLDSTLNPGAAKRKFLKGQLTKLLPGKGKNRLFAELVALKFNIAASQLGKTPAGFGDLLYDDGGSNPYNNRSIMDISAKADTMMTYWKDFTSVNFDTLYNTVYRINRAFVGVLDTATFYQGGLLSLKGSTALSTVPFLKQAVRPATRLGLTTLETESLEDFEDAEWDNAVDGTPLAAKLYQNYPNPFNPTTNIAFRLLEPSLVTLKVFNILGQEVATLLNNEEIGDEYVTVPFDARNLASGVYFYKVDVKNSETGMVAPLSMQKMMLLK